MTPPNDRKAVEDKLRNMTINANGDGLSPRAVTYILTLISTAREDARKVQDAYSRADEFLWFRRKLKEYMPQKIQARYKGFLDNFVEPNAAKYLEQMPEIEKRLAALSAPVEGEK
jgi:N-glycosylase/DNA lyase